MVKLDIMDNDSTEKLIEAVKKRPALYLNCNPLFHNHLWQEEAWREVAQELNYDITVLKSRWKYLKSTYTQCKRVQQNPNSITPRYKININFAQWVWGKHLSFLEENYVDETRSRSPQVAADEKNSDTFAHNDMPINSQQREEMVKSEPSPEPSSAFAENTEIEYSGRRRIDTDPEMCVKEEKEEDGDIFSNTASPNSQEMLKTEWSPEPSPCALLETKVCSEDRYRRKRIIESVPDVDQEEENEENGTTKNIQKSTSSSAADEENSDTFAPNDMPINSQQRGEMVKSEPSPEPSSAFAENTENEYSGRRRIDTDPEMCVKEEKEEDGDIFSNTASPNSQEMLKTEWAPEPSPCALLETKVCSEDRYRRKRRIESVADVDQEEENEENGTMKNIQKSTSTSDNSCNNEKVEVKCDAVDLLFLGYADTFKKLSRRKQVLVKFEIAKAFVEAELNDISDR